MDASLRRHDESPMTTESDFIAALRRIVSDEAARGLMDDAAVLEIGGERLVLTHDMIVEGVHFLPEDPPADVAWKLVAVNLSDLAAKGAVPAGALLGYALGGAEWDAAFLAGLERVLGAFGLPLLGGDTVAAPRGAPRAFGLTAIGRAAGPVPSRGGAGAGDHLWVSGEIGDSGLGLRIARGDLEGPPALVERYRTPVPRLELGQCLAPLASAMMDVSDGLLIDARRMAEASGLAAAIDLRLVPLSEAFLDLLGEDRSARVAAAIAGDDYELLFAAPPAAAPEILALSDRLAVPVTRIGAMAEGEGLQLSDGGESVAAAGRLGFEHGG